MKTVQQKNTLHLIFVFLIENLNTGVSNRMNLIDETKQNPLYLNKSQFRSSCNILALHNHNYVKHSIHLITETIEINDI
jgi:hypothetical protein